MTEERPPWAHDLDLLPHPEGGWYRETWRSDVVIPLDALPAGYSGTRRAGTAILFLLEPGQQSDWHTVLGAELWLYHRGGPMVVSRGGDGDALGEVSDLVLGPDTPQVLVPPRHWQRARPLRAEPALVSCIVVPGFDFADFRLVSRAVGAKHRTHQDPDRSGSRRSGR